MTRSDFENNSAGAARCARFRPRLWTNHLVNACATTARPTISRSRVLTSCRLCVARCSLGRAQGLTSPRFRLKQFSYIGPENRPVFGMMPFSRRPTTLTHKAILWFAALLVVVAVPPTERIRSVTRGQSPFGVQEIVWANSALATSHYAIRLGNSGTPGARATSTNCAEIAKEPAPSGSHSSDALGLDTTVIVPAGSPRFVAEIQVFPPDFALAALSWLFRRSTSSCGHLVIMVKPTKDRQRDNLDPFTVDLTFNLKQEFVAQSLGGGDSH